MSKRKPLVIIPEDQDKATQLRFEQLIETVNAVQDNGSMQVWVDDELDQVFNMVDAVNEKAESLIEQATQSLKKLSR